MKKVGLEFVHDELYGTALEVSKKFVSNHEGRPILNYTLHQENGDLVATDSHKLLHVKDIHGFKDEYLVSPKTLMFAKGKFPDLRNVMEKEEHSEVIKINKEQIKLWLQIFKSINQIFRTMKDRSNIITLRFGDDSLSVYIKSQNVTMQLPADKYEKLEGLDKISFRPEYLKDALEAHQKLNSQELTFYFRTSFRPMIIEDGSRVTAVVLPIRTY